MKKVINGAVYNTDTAEFLGGYGRNLDDRLSKVVEDLYRTKSGKFFIHGIGGPASKYAKQTGQNNWSGDEKIIPMSADTAREWAEEHLSTEMYTAAFGEPEEAADETERLVVYMPAAVKAKLRAVKEQTGKSESQIVAEMLSERL